MKLHKNARKPVLPKDYAPLPPQNGDEYFCNGIFCFNIARMIDDIANNRCRFIKGQTEVAVWVFDSTECKLNNEYVDAADLSRPVIIAEISPDRLTSNQTIDEKDWRTRGYNLLDGHHRIEKARRAGINTLQAVILPMESHIMYMYEGFEAYKDYWKEKCELR